tara:strand:- start:4964 stop:5464 length:501 start_codon:yes stop_codon:yes gene_type:complete
MVILSEKINKTYLNEALKIYNFYIHNSNANFEENKISLQSFIKLYKKIRLNKLPFIVALKNEVVVGIAFVNKFREKSGYRFTHEHSIYIHPKFVKKGYGSVILKELVKLCKKNNNIKNLIAVIGGSDNLGSIKIHKKNGFNYIGTLKKVGFKRNKWIDSIYMQKKL